MLKIFTPIQLRHTEIPNRILFPSMTTRLADPEGFVTEESIAYFRERAKNGVGLVTVEMSSPEKAGRHRAHEVGIYDDKFIPGLKRLSKAIQDAGARASIQIGHAGGHTRPKVTGELPIGPSAVEHIVEEVDTERVLPLAMSKARIDEAVRSFVKAALRAREAGFDVVELHGAHGYLIFQFLSPLDNKRQDEYGGSLQNRARFPIAIMKACRHALPEFPIIFRLSIKEYAEGGLQAEEGVQVAEWLAEAGADAIHASACSYRTTAPIAVIPPMIHSPGVFVPLARMVKEKVRIPVIAVGRLHDPDLVEEVLRKGYADMVAIGRGLIADPEWMAKTRKGTPQEIRVCLSCNTCINTMRQGVPLKCLVNPAAGSEREFIISPAREPQNILVAGGGPSGLEAARILTVRGHRVTLVERKSAAGGSLRLAMKAPVFQKMEMNSSLLEKFVEYQIRAAKSAGAEILLDTPLDEKLLDRLQPQWVILATGASYKFPLNIAVPFLLHSGLAGIYPFKNVIQRIHESPAWEDRFFKKLRRPNAELCSLLEKKKIKFMAIGDCCLPGKTQEAILSAFQISMGI